VLRKVQRGEWLPPLQVYQDMPPALDAICHKVMGLAPSERYATALDLAADVEHWLADEPVAAYREPWTARAVRWVKLHRVLVTGWLSTPLVAYITVSATFLACGGGSMAVLLALVGLFGAVAVIVVGETLWNSSLGSTRR
jgi:hypothetical protein